MKISIKWSIVAFLGLCLGAASVEAQSGQDAQAIGSLARGVVAMPAPSVPVNEGEVIEELPAVVAPRWSAADEGFASSGAAHELYWLGLFSLCVGAATALTLRRRAPQPEPRHALPPSEGRISFV
jgi:hypothetical protein